MEWYFSFSYVEDDKLCISSTTDTTQAPVVACYDISRIEERLRMQGYSDVNIITWKELL